MKRRNFLKTLALSPAIALVSSPVEAKREVTVLHWMTREGRIYPLDLNMYDIKIDGDLAVLQITEHRNDCNHKFKQDLVFRIERHEGLDCINMRTKVVHETLRGKHDS